MVRAASVLLKLVGSVTGIVFLAAYLGGFTTPFAGERIALALLLAGLGTAVLDGYHRGKILGKTALVHLTLLAAWALFLRFPF